MDFIRYRVEESAKAAASAARQLSSLDEMAQSDHYIQSDGLRVSDKKQPPSASSSFSDNSPSVVEDLSGRFVDALSMAARKQNRPRPTNGKPHSPHHHEGRRSTPVELGKAEGETIKSYSGSREHSGRSRSQ